MNTFAEFQIVGHVGKIIRAGTALRVSIAAEHRRKNDEGGWEAKTQWNTVTIFHKNTVDWAEDHLRSGDLVHVRGTIRETKHEKNGETRFGVTLAASMFDRLVAKEKG